MTDVKLPRVKEQLVTDIKLPILQEQPAHATLPRVAETPKIASQELPKMPNIFPLLDSELCEPPPIKMHANKKNNTNQHHLLT